MGRKPKSFISENGRECLMCGKFKLWAEYGVWSMGPHGHRGACRPCCRAYNKARNATPKVRASRKASDKVRCDTPKYRAYNRARNASPEYRAYQKAYRSTPERRACDRAYQATPEYRAYRVKCYWDSSKVRICGAISRGLRQSLKGGKGGRHWEDILGWKV